MRQTKNNNLQKNACAKLMPLIPFDEADAAVNDDGFFSGAQQKRLKPKTDLYIGLSTIGAFFGFVVSAIFFFVGQDSNDYLIPTAVSLAIFGGCFYAICWSLSRARQIKKGFGVKRVEGFAELSIAYTGKNRDIPVYKLCIGEIEFRLDEAVYNAFAEGEYRIFYFPLLRNELLSVETFD